MEGAPALLPGDRPDPALVGQTGRLFAEITALWLVTNLLIRGAVALNASVGHDVIIALVPILFIYAPVLLCRLRGVDSFGYRLHIPALGDRAAWWEALRLTGGVVAVIIAPYLIGYHLYQTQLFGHSFGGRLPEDIALLIAHQVLFVAIPEEFFYRGYVQTRLNERFARKFLVFGVPMGWGSVIACLYFAFGHSLVEVQWWHFATFFPGMVFAWMREKTGGVVAGAFFHAFCNISVQMLDTMYGVR